MANQLALELATQLESGGRVLDEQVVNLCGFETIRHARLGFAQREPGERHWCSVWRVTSDFTQAVWLVEHALRRRLSNLTIMTYAVYSNDQAVKWRATLAWPAGEATGLTANPAQALTVALLRAVAHG